MVKKFELWLVALDLINNSLNVWIQKTHKCKTANVIISWRTCKVSLKNKCSVIRNMESSMSVESLVNISVGFVFRENQCNPEQMICWMCTRDIHGSDLPSWSKELQWWTVSSSGLSLEVYSFLFHFFFVSSIYFIYMKDNTLLLLSVAHCSCYCFEDSISTHLGVKYQYYSRDSLIFQWKCLLCPCGQQSQRYLCKHL